MITDKQIEAAALVVFTATVGRAEEYLKAKGQKRRKDFDRLIRRALEAAEAAAWKPIETAPRDGNTVLVACRDHQWSIRIAAYIPRFFEESAEDEAEYDEVSYKYYAHEGWYEQCLEHDEYMAIHMHKPPTHWRPLPGPPKEASDAK